MGAIHDKVKKKRGGGGGGGPKGRRSGTNQVMKAFKGTWIRHQKLGSRQWLSWAKELDIWGLSKTFVSLTMVERLFTLFVNKVWKMITRFYLAKPMLTKRKKRRINYAKFVVDRWWMYDWMWSLSWCVLKVSIIGIGSFFVVYFGKFTWMNEFFIFFPFSMNND